MLAFDARVQFRTVDVLRLFIMLCVNRRTGFSVVCLCAKPRFSGDGDAKGRRCRELIGASHIFGNGSHGNKSRRANEIGQK
jgi:hypothetical protein